jgi:hypothetical protein
MEPHLTRLESRPAPIADAVAEKVAEGVPLMAWGLAAGPEFTARSARRLTDIAYAGSKDLLREVCPSVTSTKIRSMQPDRDHAVLEVVGAPGLECVDELRQRVEGLLVAGVRYLLVDLAEAVPGDAVVRVLADAARRLEERQGWLRVNRQDSSLPVSLPEATLGDLFAIYRSFARGRGRWDGAHA